MHMLELTNQIWRLVELKGKKENKSKSKDKEQDEEMDTSANTSTQGILFTLFF